MAERTKATGVVFTTVIAWYKFTPHPGHVVVFLVKDTMIIFAWGSEQETNKFTWEEVKLQPENLEW